MLKDTMPKPMNIAYIIVYLSALLLLQGLIRDCWYLYCARGVVKKSQLHTNPILGLCVESTVGGVGIVVGLVLLFLASGLTFNLSASLWVALMLLTLVFGFIVKDFVFQVLPFRIHKDVNHMNVIIGRNQ